MRAVIQRVSKARVIIGGNEHSKIGRGMLVLLGVEKEDSADDASVLARRIVEFRMFEDDDGKMNRTIADAGGAILVVSQFTLLGDCRRGRRPSFDHAAPADIARNLYQQFINEVHAIGIPAESGVFQSTMEVELTNDGPVTFILDSRR